MKAKQTAKTEPLATVPTADYSPTPAEAAMVRRYFDRQKSSPPAPRVKIQHKPRKPAQIEVDHRDLKIGGVALWAAMGTTNADFAHMLIGHLMNAACPGGPNTSLSEEALNGALAAMHAIAPRDEVEAMLAAQMVATHVAAMTQLRRLKGVETIPQLESNGTLTTKLLRTFTMQVEALQRYRGKGHQQTVRVEHVTVQAGGQAIVGNVAPGGSGTHSNSEGQGHAQSLTHAPGETLPGALAPNREAVPRAGDA